MSPPAPRASRGSAIHVFSDVFLVYGLVLWGVLVLVKLRGVFVFEITKTKTSKFIVKFDLKLSGKNRTEDNLTD